MDWVKAFGDYVPLFQTLAWILFILISFRIFRPQFQSLFLAVISRIRTGSGLKVGPVELSPDLRALRYVSSEQPTPPSTGITVEDERDLSIVEERIKQRHSIYEKHRDLFIVHVLSPSQVKGQEYDVFIYLIRHDGDQEKPADLSDVEKAEFFFGGSWGNRIFVGTRKGKHIGVSTSAYGSFLCTCLVTFKDGEHAMLDRYVDFEMGDLLKTVAGSDR
jgi:hypothetical protein